MIKRTLQAKLLQSARKYPLVAVVGPRQSGKTTLVKSAFPQRRYISLEDIDIRLFAETDPRRFLETYSPPAILDEIQKAPDLFSYLQTNIDKKDQTGQYILTGSQNFLLLEKISQSLAGRIAILTLLPLSMEELDTYQSRNISLSKLILTGFYPRIYDKKIDPSDWYPSYIQTYIERDVRQIQNITDLTTFQNFVKLCAGRTGQILNISSLAQDTAISPNTAKAWVAVLEASYIIFLLKPYYRNFNKRLIKSPKLYFYDSGLVANLLGIKSADQLNTHYLWGSLFETFIIGELRKQYFNLGKVPADYYWRDKTGNEIDYLVDETGRVVALEIKAGKTVTNDYFRSLDYFAKLAEGKLGRRYVVYAGESSQKRRAATVLSWQELEQVFFFSQGRG